MLEEIEENSPLNCLIKALNNVKIEYFRQQYQYVQRGFQKPERIFVAELYHQLRKLQETNECDLQNLLFHVETTKQKFDSINPINHCIKDFRYKRMSPDLILHKSQNNSEGVNQVLVCEMKMEGASWNSLDKDLKKLLFYKLSRLKYQNAVFIFTGSKQYFEEFLHENYIFPFEVNQQETLYPCLKENKIVFAFPDKIKNKNNCYTWNMFHIQ